MMSKIGIFFGTDTGSTRLVAKKIYRTHPNELLAYDALILGIPSYGIGDLPGLAVGCQEANWAEFVPYLDGADLTGKRVALFGLGHQERYAKRFASSLIQLYRIFYGYGAEMIGRWNTEGYQFEHSDSIINGQFVGLVLDQRGQPHLTEERIKIWLAQITPQLLQVVTETA
jgi:flavodoxin I